MVVPTSPLVSAVRTEREIEPPRSRCNCGSRTDWGRREGEIIDDVVFVGFVVNLVEAGADAGGQQRRIPLVGLAWFGSFLFADIGRSAARLNGRRRRLDGARQDIPRVRRSGRAS